VTDRARGAIAAALLAAAAGGVLSACGGDDAPDPGNEASFCRLAEENDPVAEADLETLERLGELAPVEIRESVTVLVELAAQLDDAGVDSADALAIEFEVRFSDEYIDARRDVEVYQDAECRPATTTTSVTVTTTTAGEDIGDGSDTDEGSGEDDG
jgi:hypothetical protein